MSVSVVVLKLMMMVVRMSVCMMGFEGVGLFVLWFERMGVRLLNLFMVMR